MRTCLGTASRTQSLLTHNERTDEPNAEPIHTQRTNSSISQSSSIRTTSSTDQIIVQHMRRRHYLSDILTVRSDEQTSCSKLCYFLIFSFKLHSRDGKCGKLQIIAGGQCIQKHVLYVLSLRLLVCAFKKIHRYAEKSCQIWRKKGIASRDLGSYLSQVGIQYDLVLWSSSLCLSKLFGLHRATTLKTKAGT